MKHHDSCSTYLMPYQNSVLNLAKIFILSMQRSRAVLAYFLEVMQRVRDDPRRNNHLTIARTLRTRRSRMSHEVVALVMRTRTVHWREEYLRPCPGYSLVTWSMTSQHDDTKTQSHWLLTLHSSNHLTDPWNAFIGHVQTYNIYK